jgi:antitoxin YefM
MKEHLNESQEAQDILVLTGPKKKDFIVLTLETFINIASSEKVVAISLRGACLLKMRRSDRALKCRTAVYAEVIR